MSKQRFLGRAEATGTPKGRRLCAWRWAFLLVAAAMSLGCMTVEIGLKVAHQPRQEDQVSFEIAQQLTDTYIKAAEPANKELRADYAKLGKEPSFRFPQTLRDVSENMPELIAFDPQAPPEGFKVITNTNGFAAEATFGLKEWLQKQEESDRRLLHVDTDDPEGTRYTVWLDLPAMDVSGEDPRALYEDLEKLRREGMPPKPQLEKLDEDELAEEADKIAEQVVAKKPEEKGLVDRPGDEQRAITLSGLDRLFGALAAGTGDVLAGLELEMWYGARILKDAGPPQITWVVELPGKIESHTVDDRPAGVRKGNQVTLVMDKDFFNTFGPGEHRFRVESFLNICEDICGERPHQIWNGESVAPDCGCVCEKGWEMQTSNECEACEDFCDKYGADYDSAKSKVNKCGCKCRGRLLEFQRGAKENKCVCVPFAKPKGEDECECVKGWAPSAEGDRCVELDPEVKRKLEDIDTWIWSSIPDSVIGLLLSDLRGKTSEKVEKYLTDKRLLRDWYGLTPEEAGRIVELHRAGLPAGFINELMGKKWTWQFYVTRVLDFLHSAASDPERKGLVEGFEYDVVEVSPGGPQAVVIYPKGTDWRETGIVVDHWFGGGIGGHGQSWKTWVERYGQAQSRLIQYMADQAHQSEQEAKKRAVVRSPVDVLVIGGGGQRIGRLPDGTFVNEMPGAEFATWRLPEGTLGWYFGLPEGSHEMTLTGTGTGHIHLLTSGEEGVIYSYGSQPINPGEQATVTLDSASPLTPLRLPSGEEIVPTTEIRVEIDEALGVEGHEALGDGNGDGRCTEVDALVALRMAVGLQVPDAAKVDVNGDGQVTEVDALQILKWAVAGGQCGQEGE